MPSVSSISLSPEMDFMRDKRLHEIDELLYYSIDERENTINLNEKGRSSLSPEEQKLFVLPDITEGIHEIDSDESLSEKEKRERKMENQKFMVEEAWQQIFTNIDKNAGTVKRQLAEAEKQLPELVQVFEYLCGYIGFLSNDSWRYYGCNFQVLLHFVCCFAVKPMPS